MKCLTRLATLVITIVIASSVQATTLFQLAASADVEAVDEANSFSLTYDGITATLTAIVSGNAGPNLLNTTLTSGFGVNAGGTGDQTSQIDNALGIESVSITFNVPVKLDQIVLSDFFAGASDLASLTIDGFTPLTLNPTAPALDVYNFITNNTLLPGQSIVLTYLAGNGFSFDSFSVTKIPEPASGVLLLIGLAATHLIRRSQLKG